MTIFQSGPSSDAPGPLNIGESGRTDGSVQSTPQVTSSGMATNSLTPIPILGRGFRDTWVMPVVLPASGTSFNVRADYGDLGVVPGARGILVANGGGGTLSILMNRTNFTYNVAAGRSAFLPLFMAANMIDLTFTDTSGFASCSALLTSEEMVPFSI
jgi:hypothetical protein